APSWRRPWYRPSPAPPPRLAAPPAWGRGPTWQARACPPARAGEAISPFGSRGERVHPSRVLGQDPLPRLATDVLAPPQLTQARGEIVIPVRDVAGVEQCRIAEATHHLWHGRLARFDREVQPTAAPLLTRPPPAQ